MKKMIIPICFALTLCACNTESTVQNQAKDARMKNTEVSTEQTSETEITFESQNLPEYDFVKQFGFVESPTAIISTAGETGFTIDFAEGSKRGLISVSLSSQEFNDFDRQTQDIASHIEGSYIQDSHIMPEGFKEIVYTNEVDDMGEVTRLIEYKKYSETETLVITIYLPVEDYDNLIDKAVEVVQSLKV